MYSQTCMVNHQDCSDTSDGIEREERAHDILCSSTSIANYGHFFNMVSDSKLQISLIIALTGRSSSSGTFRDEYAGRCMILRHVSADLPRHRERILTDYRRLQP